MSTKELYTALLDARMDTAQSTHQMQLIHEMDDAIHDWITAESKLNSLIASHCSVELLRRRLKLILCEEVAKQYKPIEPAAVMGSEAEQLQALATAAGCPKITAWFE